MFSFSHQRPGDTAIQGHHVSCDLLDRKPPLARNGWLIPVLKVLVTSLKIAQNVIRTTVLAGNCIRFP